jgi:tRNA pseudouridine55 synthase
MNGVLVIDKPRGLTSHDVVGCVRRILGQRAVGHLGTLDPAATGVLPLVLGNMTRLAQFYLKSQKTYQGLIRFGIETDTYDAEGEPLGAPRKFDLTLERVRQLAGEFQGTIQQLPPPFSAKKIAGVPAYKLARKKKEVLLKPVQVEIKDFAIATLDGDCASFRACVGSGTYLRSIAHDLGRRAGCGAHLAALRRNSVAEFDLAEAHSLEAIENAARGGELEGLLVHPRKLLPETPAVTVTDDTTVRIRHGQAVNLPELSRSREVKVFCGQRDLIAICSRVAGTLFHPRIVLA